MLQQRCFDLSQFDALPAAFDLAIPAPVICQRPVPALPDKIARQIKPLAGAERIRAEPICRQARIAHIAPGQRHSPDGEFPQTPGRQSVALTVKHFGDDIGNRPTDRHFDPVLGAAYPCRDVDCGLGGAVEV